MTSRLKQGEGEGCWLAKKDNHQSYQLDRSLRSLATLCLRDVGQHPHVNLAARKVRPERVEIRGVRDSRREGDVYLFAVDSGGPVIHRPRGGCDWKD